MEKVKEFVKNHNKVIILAAILLVLVIAAGIAMGICFSAQPASVGDSVAKQSGQQVAQKDEEEETSGNPDEGAPAEDTLSSSTESTGNIEDKGQEGNKGNEGSGENASSGENTGGQPSSSNGTGSSSANPSSHAGSSEVKPGNGTANAGCNHEWVTRIETVQEPITVTVTSEQREYTLYRFYWYNSGTWEETRDSERFAEWSHSADGMLYPLYNAYERPEDNPLFQGYDGNGNPTYTNDHSIISGLFEEVPCEPYEKTEMATVTYEITICSKCGATQ